MTIQTVFTHDAGTFTATTVDTTPRRRTCDWCEPAVPATHRQVDTHPTEGAHTNYACDAHTAQWMTPYTGISGCSAPELLGATA